MNRFHALLAVAALSSVAMPAQAQEAPISFVAIGDTGYIPAYETLDEDEEPFATLGEYLGAHAEGWLDHHPDLSDFTPTPWTFESTLGGFTSASGMYPVARAAAEVCASQGCDFGAMLGDNIYPDGATLGADGISDARRFSDMLDKPYGRFGAGTENFTIYTMMGNHDWHISREATEAQLTYLQQHPNFTMPDLFYKAVPVGMEGEVEIFVVDTEMLLASTTVYKDELDAEGNEIQTGELESWDDYVKPASPAEKNMVSWLEQSLAQSNARWKVVFGHHALWSSGGSKYEKARSLRKLLLPAICKYADAYISGDDHLMEAYSDDCSTVADAADGPVPMFVAGAGSKYRQQDVAFAAQQKANNPQMTNLFSKGSTWGFLHVTLQDDLLNAAIYSTPGDMSGRPIKEFEQSFANRSK
ncbi:metallophosphoesterase [Altericroceibacterium endophyticum]|nr:metallophosphoesterase [Altericroceibacterium endophyticum]